MNSRKWVVAALGLAGALCAGAASAHGNDIQWSVTIGAPVYSQPAPVYVPQPVYTTPAPVYGGYYQQHRAYRQPTRWDADGDGIPNRYDRVYNPRWDRDGDGVPNRYDRYDNNRGWRR
jgi:hypothetical protein